MASGFLQRCIQGNSPAAACQAPQETCSEAGGRPATSFISGVEIVVITLAVVCLWHNSLFLHRTAPHVLLVPLVPLNLSFFFVLIIILLSL